MIFKIAGGVFFVLEFLTLTGIYAAPDPIIGVVALIAGIALVAGI